MPIFHGLVPIFSRFIRDINGEKKISLLMIVFSRFAPSRAAAEGGGKTYRVNLGGENVLQSVLSLVARAIRNAIRANRFARIIRN